MVGITECGAPLDYYLAPLRARRDIEMLGQIHRSVQWLRLKRFKTFFVRMEMPWQTGMGLGRRGWKGIRRVDNPMQARSYREHALHSCPAIAKFGPGFDGCMHSLVRVRARKRERENLSTSIARNLTMHCKMRISQVGTGLTPTGGRNQLRFQMAEV